MIAQTDILPSEARTSAPHPSAAKVFINWFLSRKGRKYLDVARPEYADMAPIFELAKSIMKSRDQGK
jgi:ABC-type Fe3+ transport system substrate-binding protein